MISLPTNSLPPESKSPNFILLYGIPKVGKTKILSELKNNLLVSLDPKGADHLNCLRVQVNNFREFNEVKDLLVKNPSKYKFISIDTATALEDFCDSLATIQYKNFSSKFAGSSVTEVGEGYGYKWLRNAFNKMIDPLFSLNSKLIFTCHVRNKFMPETVEAKNVENLETEKELDLSAGVQRLLVAKMDCMGKLYRKDGELMVKFTDNKQSGICGSRYEHLVNQDIKFNWKTIYPDMDV